MSSEFTGFLNLYKLIGPTSHDCIRELKRIFSSENVPIPKLGHMGTLDPLAEGILPIAIGSSARLIEYFHGSKVYLAKIRLGVSTTTDDIDGDIIEEHEIPGITEEELTASLNEFVGEISQVPPSFSAVKADGRRAYDLARRGDAADLKPRKVTINSAELLEWNPPFLEARFSVGRGTYIRSIARDLGASYGTGGCLESLKREADGVFDEDGSVTIEELKNDGVNGIVKRLHPPDTILRHLPEITVDVSSSSALQDGKTCEGLASNIEDGNPIRVYDPDGFLGIAEIIEDGNLKAKKVIRRRV